MRNDPLADVAFLLHPDPLPFWDEDYETDAERERAQIAAQEAREALLAELRERADVTDEDVLLELLAHKQQIQRQADQDVRMMVAYMRAMKPRPYTLAQLGRALRLNTSTVGDMVNANHRRLLAARLPKPLSKQAEAMFAAIDAETPFNKKEAQ